jgi:hypothetical protein
MDSIYEFVISKEFHALEPARNRLKCRFFCQRVGGTENAYAVVLRLNQIPLIEIMLRSKQPPVLQSTYEVYALAV